MRYEKSRPLALSLSREPFTLAQARKAGVTRSRSRAGDLLLPSQGLRIPKNAGVDLLADCRALTSLTRESVVSHVTAAKLHGLYLPSRLENLPHVDLSRRRGEPQPRRRLVTGHNLKLERCDVVVMGGVPVTTAWRTLLDIAPLLGIEEMVAIADQIVCEHHSSCVPFKFPLLNLEALHAYIAEHAGERGTRELRAAMELVRVGADSPRETQLRLIIARSPLPDFEHNIELKDATGRPLVQPDLSCEKYKTCAEYEGVHHFTPEQQRKDHERNFVTKSLGWHQVLINKADMQAGERVVVTKIARMLQQAGWPDPHNLAGRSLQVPYGSRRGYG